jgi:hypothetical protein
VEETCARDAYPVITDSELGSGKNLTNLIKIKKCKELLKKDKLKDKFKIPNKVVNKITKKLLKFQVAQLKKKLATSKFQAKQLKIKLKEGKKQKAKLKNYMKRLKKEMKKILLSQLIIGTRFTKS